MVTGFFTDHAHNVKQTSYGYATSADGIRWSEMRPLGVRFGDCITACSFIPEGGGRYAVFVTAREGGYERFAKITVRLSLAQ